MKRDWLMKLSIPTIYIIGMIAFLLIPLESRTINNFISYMSSLSTVIMVLVYIFTTSLQLSAMRSQLAEMQYSRNVQSQPLVSVENTKTCFKTPRYYVSPTTDFKELQFICQIHFKASVTNIGNSPSVATDFIPRILSVDETTLLDTSLGERIECLSLREGDKGDVLIVFDDRQHRIAQALLDKRAIFLRLVIVYKNALGMPFKQQIEFVAMVPSVKERDKLKLCLKAIKTVEIDFGKEVKEYESLMKNRKTEKALKILKKLEKDVKKTFGYEEEIELRTIIKSGSFSVKPISQSEYETLIAEKEEMQKKVLAPWKEVPWFLKR